MTDETRTPDTVTLAAEIVSAYVTKNPVPRTNLPGLIGSVHAALQNAGQPAPQPEEKPIPAVPIRKSITPDHLVSLIDGKPYKSLKRHLSGHGLTPEQYRERFGLARDYPMVAENYAKQRSELAKSIGLGQSRQRAATKAANTSATVSDKAPVRPRRRKA